MITKISDNYISNRAWFRDVLRGQDVILRGVSALEYLQLFDGYVGESKIYVYAKSRGIYENIDYQVIDTFDNVDYFNHDSILCSSANQAINDLFMDYGNTDEQALTEALSNYYHTHDMCFDGLNIKYNQEKYEELKNWAINFLCKRLAI